MGQSKATLVLPADQVSRINDLLLSLETELGQLTAMQPQQRQRLFKMGSGSDVYGRRALEALAQNPDIIPPSLAAEMPGAKADLLGTDQLRPILDPGSPGCAAGPRIPIWRWVAMSWTWPWRATSSSRSPAATMAWKMPCATSWGRTGRRDAGRNGPVAEAA